MNKFLDLIIATQLSTSFAWMCIIGAHLVDKYAYESWQFSTWVLAVIALVFWLAPYLIFERKESHNPFKGLYIDEKGWVHDREQWIKDNCK